MSKKVFTDAFFTQFHDFLKQLIQVFPGDSDFPAYDSALTFMQRLNPAMVVSEFKTNVFPYEEILRAKNSDFFLNHTFDEVVTTDMSMEAIIMKLKGLWSGLSDKSRESIWTYIILLLDIAKRC
jgi:hypothetical protein